MVCWRGLCSAVVILLILLRRSSWCACIHQLVSSGWQCHGVGGARGVFSGTVVDHVPSMDFGSPLLWRILGGTSLPAGMTLFDPGREGKGPFSESETLR
jgi:hypothetical protein